MSLKNTDIKIYKAVIFTCVYMKFGFSHCWIFCKYSTEENIWTYDRRSERKLEKTS